MRILPGPPQGFANETTTSDHLFRYAVNQPEFLAHIPSMYKAETPLTSLLARRGNLFGSNDFSKIAEKGYTRVGSREIKWSVEGVENRVLNIVKDYVSDAYPDEPGKNRTEFYVYTDTNWASPRDVLELADNRTLIYNHSNKLPVEVETGVFEYKFKLITTNEEDYVDPELLKPGHDASVLYNMYEEMSETAYEKYTFHEEARTWLTIMRLKWSISGTAEAMKSNTPIWVTHNGVNMWMTHQEAQMLKRWAMYRENQILFGKRTVGDDGKPTMTLEDSQIDIWAGDGLMNQGDGVWKMPYNNLTTNVIETVCKNMAISSSFKGGDTAVAVLCGRSFSNNFSRIMKQEAGIDPQVVVNDKNGKGIDADYQWYKFGGIKFYPLVWNFLDSPERAGRANVDEYGNRLESHRAIFISLGDLEVGKPQVELLSLGDRNFKKGSVNGINRGGDMANSVDAGHHHILSETGIANRDFNGIAELYMPMVKKNSVYVGSKEM